MTQPLSAPSGRSNEEPEPVSLRFRFDSETVEQFAERYASDVSRGGIFVHSKQPLAVGTQLRLDLQLLDGTPLIVGEGTVFWTRETDPNKPGTVPGMGIRFSKLNGRSQQIIEHVLTQRTGRERSGLFSSVNPAMSVEESQRIVNPKSKLPFNVFPGRPNSTGSMQAARIGASGPAGGDERELLANAGREEATPLVGVSAATLADARPGEDEAASRTPPPAKIAAPNAEASMAQSGKRPPLSLIKPGAGGDKSSSENSGLHRKPTPAVTGAGKTPSGAHRAPSGAHAAAPVTSTQEVKSPFSGSTLSAPVQGEPALGASHSAVPRPIDVSGAIAASGAANAPVPSLKPPMTKKLVIGAAALLGVGLAIFAATRSSGPTISPETKPIVRATATASATTPATEPAAANAAAAATAPAGSEPAATASNEGSSAPSLEPEATGGTASGKGSSTSRNNDRRPSKGKPPAPAHRGPEPAVAARAATPAEKPTPEAPAHVEPPAPTPPPAPAPAPVAVARAEPPAAKTISPTAPPPVATIAHKLRLTSIPSEAEVELDGKVVGRTPLFGVEIDVTHPHMLVVRKDGFAPFKQTISSGSEWSVRPSENSATLRIQALLKK